MQAEITALSSHTSLSQVGSEPLKVYILARFFSIPGISTRPWYERSPHATDVSDTALSKQMRFNCSMTRRSASKLLDATHLSREQDSAIGHEQAFDTRIASLISDDPEASGIQCIERFRSPAGILHHRLEPSDIREGHERLAHEISHRHDCLPALGIHGHRAGVGAGPGPRRGLGRDPPQTAGYMGRT
jgi:hypothetical protein